MSHTFPILGKRTRPIPPTDPDRAPTTWRCKECHGWDYRGADGAYAAGIAAALRARKSMHTRRRSN